MIMFRMILDCVGIIGLMILAFIIPPLWIVLFIWFIIYIIKLFWKVC